MKYAYLNQNVNLDGFITRSDNNRCDLEPTWGFLLLVAFMFKGIFFNSSYKMLHLADFVPIKISSVTRKGTSVGVRKTWLRNVYSELHT